MLAPADHSMQQAQPRDVELEQALLGAVLTNNDAFWRVADLVSHEHFSEPIHQKIYSIAAAMIRAGKPASPLTLRTFLPADLDIAGLNVSQYLARLAAEAVSVVNVIEYGRSLVDLARRRDLLDISDRLADSAANPEPDKTAAMIAAEAEQELFALSSADSWATTNRAPVSIGKALAEAVDSAAQAYQRGGQISGVTWGLRDVDRMTLGLHAGEVVILAGRPGMGKTAVALSVIRAAAEAGEPGLFFSHEMSAAQIGTRWLAEGAARTGPPISYFNLKGGNISPEDFDRVADAARAYEELPVMIDDQPSVTVAQIGMRVRRRAQIAAKEGKPLKLVAVDYLQLIKATDRYRGQRTSEVTEISAGLKHIARENNVAMLVLSQLSREVERRDDKRPQLSDLRDSGSIEQDADSVIFLFREEYYLRNKEPKAGTEEFYKWQADMEACHGRLDFILGKQRHGPTGTVTVMFDAKTNTVRDMVEDDRLPRML